MQALFTFSPYTNTQMEAVSISKDKESRTAESLAIAEASREIIRRYGEAGRQYVIAYSGVADAVQVQFVGADAKECLTLLHSAEYRTKYFSKGIRLEIPAEYYDEVLRLDPSLRGSITKSSVTRAEAVSAVRSPLMTTARNVAGVSHRAELEGAGYGAGMAGAIAGAEAGQAVITVPVVGAVAGSVVGYAVSGEVFRRMKMFLDGKELAREERLGVKRECREAMKALEEFRAKAESVVSEYLAGSIRVFREAFGVMDEAMMLGDVDGYITGANMLARRLGGGVQFEDIREFDALMMSEEAFVL